MALYDTILITGGGGMLAHALDDILTARGHKPIRLSRAECDIANDEHLRRAFEHKPTLVLNCAAHTKVDLCESEPEKANAINGYAVGKLAALCKEHGTCLVHVSTDFVFDGSKRKPYLPEDPVNPMQAYGRSKLLGETELQKHAPDRWLIVRTAWVYGRHGANFPRTMITAARAGKPLSVVADQFGSPTYTVDLAEAIIDLLDAGAAGIWHVTNAGETNWHEFAKAALEAFDIQADVKPLTSAQWSEIRPNTAARPGYSVLDGTRLSQKIGRPMRHWRDALRAFRAECDATGGF